jgi:SIR2-like domain
MRFLGKDGKFDQGAYKEEIGRHAYLKDLGRLARDAVLVVTHNFDDALEYAVDLDPTLEGTPVGRRYHSFWRPEPFLRPGMVNIYHPNGYTPLRRGFRGSENLILTEGGFADHLANTNTEESHFLVRHLADKTCLIIGHSLADSTLKNALRQHANQRPAHMNYYIHWSAAGEAGLSTDQRNAIREANFQTYNLLTIFANSAEIAAIVKLISMSEDELEGHLAAQSLPSRFVYYIVGPVSAGKSTTLRQLRNLATVEEWPAQMPVEMNRQSIGLKDPTAQRIDKRLEEAIWRKNTEIRDIKVGLVAVDRAPLDFIAFPTKKSESMGITARKRTKAVLGRLAQNDLHDLCPGQVIVLCADSRALAYRQLKRNRTTPEEVANGSTERYLKRQQELLQEAYKTAVMAGSVVHTEDYSIVGSLKAAARIIHLDTYIPFEFAKQLRLISKRQ